MEEEKQSEKLILSWVSKLREGISSLDATASELKQLDSYLRELQTLFDTFDNKTGQGIVLMQDNRYIWVNGAACDILGYPLEEILVLNPEQTILPCLRDKFLARVQMTLAGNVDEVPEEWPILRGDRTIRYVSSFVYRVTFMMKPALMVFFYDITESNKVQEDLRIRAQMLDIVSDSIMLMDMSGRMVYVNEAVSSLTGYSRDELVGMNFLTLGAPELRNRYEIRLKQFSEHKENRYTAYVLRKDGGRIRVEIRGRVIRQGGKPFLLGVAREISQSDEF